MISQFSQITAQTLFSSAKEFPVSFDDAWQWLQYEKKGNAKRYLVENLEEGIDYLINEDSTQPQFGKPRQDIYLSIEGFKNWAMMSRTDTGKLVRRYFLECEKVAKQAIQPKKPNKDLDLDKERKSGIVARREYTDLALTFKPTSKDYAIATNQTYLGLFGETAAQIKESRGLKKRQSARDGMNEIELAAVRLSELSVARNQSISTIHQLNQASFNQAQAISVALRVI